MKTETSDSSTMIEKMVNELSNLDVGNVNSTILQQFYLHSPYMIILETCREDQKRYSTYQITPTGSVSSQYSESQRRQLAARPKHKHNFIEIMFVLDGSVTNQIENQSFTYTAGQCCIMNRNIRHCEVFKGNYQAAFFMFQDNFLKAISDAYEEERQLKAASTGRDKNTVFQLINDAFSATHQFDKIYLNCLPVISTEKILEKMIPLFNDIIFETIGQKTGYFLYIQAAFMRIFDLLNSSDLYAVYQVHSDADQNEYIVTKIIHLLETGHGHVSREQLCRQLHYTGEYLNRIFKKYTGKTITSYRQQLCLCEAAKLLEDTDMSISDIISHVGFSNRSYFYRIFENAYGTTPLSYREQKRE